MKQLFREVDYFFCALFDTKQILPSKEKIDVVIPIIEKDLRILPLCVEGVRACVNHPIENIYIVAPKHEKIMLFCETNNLIYVDEASVLGIVPKELNLQITKSDGSIENRSGWLFQQLLKLSGKVGKCDNYLCIDADHILLQPHTFIDEKGFPVFYMSAEKHREYYKMMNRLLGNISLSGLSYVAHKMIFNKQQLALLHEEIQNFTNKNWIDAILENYDRTQGSGFSEFETYGNFVKQKVCLPWKQYAATYDKMDSYQKLKECYGKKYRSITFPDYYN